MFERQDRARLRPCRAAKTVLPFRPWPHPRPGTGIAARPAGQDNVSFSAATPDADGKLAAGGASTTSPAAAASGGDHLYELENRMRDHNRRRERRIWGARSSDDPAS